jgi:hypothetical protein
MKNNKFIIGFMYGILLPAAGFLLLFNAFKLLGHLGDSDGIGLSDSFRERTSAILAIALNLLPMKIFQQRRLEAPVRGVVVATAILAITWVVYFGSKIF